MIVDYPFHPDRQDFLDIWLFANCHLCVSTGSGIDCVAMVYKVPQLYVNYLPLSHMHSWTNASHSFKILRWKHSGRILSMLDYLNYSYLRTSDYIEKGIEIHSLSSAQILHAVQERLLRINGLWVDTITDQKMHNRFNSLLYSHSAASSLHGYVHEEARVSTTWLRLVAPNFIHDL